MRLQEAAWKAPRWRFLNEKGRSTLTAPAPGRYKLQTDKAGYFSRTLELEIRGETNAGAITLIRKRELRGLVRWPNGEPVARAQIIALPVQGRTVAAFPEKLRSVRADDEGEFRLTELEPARYVLYAGTVADLSAAEPGARRPVPAFYPGGNSPDVSRAFDLVEAQSVNGLTIVLAEPMGATTLEIEAQLTSGASAVIIGLSYPGHPTYFAQSRMKSGERITLQGVPKGELLLLASAGESRLAQQIRADAGNRISISIPAPSSFAVRTELLEGLAVSRPLAGVTVRLASERLGVFGLLRSVSDSGGVARFPASVPGEAYRLEVDPMPEGMYVAEIRQGEAAAGEDRIIAAGGDVRVIFRAPGAVITGQVPAGVKARAVLLVPENQELVRNRRRADVDGTGAFRLSGVAPGRYRLLAVQNPYADGFQEEYALGQAVALELEASGVYDVRLPPNVLR